MKLKVKLLKEKIQNDRNINVDIYQLDVKNKDKIKQIITKILENKTIDMLVNNAGLALGLEHIDKGSINN